MLLWIVVGSATADSTMPITLTSRVPMGAATATDAKARRERVANMLKGKGKGKGAEGRPGMLEGIWKG